MSLLHLLEPEETVGTVWHNLVGSGSTIARFPAATVEYERVAPYLRVYFRGLGGEAGIELKPAVPEVSHHRLTRLLRLGRRAERVAKARFDGSRLSLPDALDVFPEMELNERLYFWLVAWTAVGSADPPGLPSDPLVRDVLRIEHAERTSKVIIHRFPGLAKHYARLCAATLALRPQMKLPPEESRIEARIRCLLGGTSSTALQAPLQGPAPPGYRTFLPVPLWAEFDERETQDHKDGNEDDPGPGKPAGGDEKSRRAKRRTTDEINRKGGLFAHRFEKILTWTELMNLHRDVEDDEGDSAKRAADDQDEIGVGKLDRKAATRIKIDLDLAPSDIDAEELSDAHTYPEWDYRRVGYLARYTRVLERLGDALPPGTGWAPGPKAVRRIRAVRRQFEALKPKRELFSRQLDGHEFDMDALIRSQVDQRACGEGSDRVFRQARDEARDLSVAVLIDVSRSTEGFVENCAVIDVEREALVALAEGLNACGDEAAIFAFSSLRRDRVYVTKVKAFDEPVGNVVRARIAALRPGFYTRLGAAIRHVSAALSGRRARKRLLLVLTDGKPNDLDHYEGRYGVEDTRRAILEARRAGQAVFGITIDNKAQSYFPRIFGAGGYGIVRNPARLTAALPLLYRHLVS